MYNEREASLLPPGLLAYIGDCVFDLLVRKYSLKKGLRKLHTVHQNTVSLVNAKSQAKFLKSLEANLSEEERDIVRRGKNAKTGNIPKNADMIDYRLSTGFEALLGYLHLCGREERLTEIWDNIILLIEER